MGLSGQKTLVSNSAHNFNKRFYSGPRQFLDALRNFAEHADELSGLRRRGLVSRTFAERIMLAVTAVNGCRYCSYAHAKWALQSGIEAGELRGFLDGEIDHAPKKEVPALLFAQHYAESGDRPDPQMIEKLIKTYGPEKARDIMAYIRMITVGNLVGNTFDAFISRLRGAPAPDSRPVNELATLALLVFGTIPFSLAVMVKRLFKDRRR